jgi:hypothetical protein
MPLALRKIADQALKKHKSIDDQLEFVMAEVQSLIRYIGDWRLVKGKYHPRELKEVVSSGFGDCKDFAMVTVAILDSMKIKSDWTLVNRSYYPQLNDRKTIPGYLAFNHVIVHVQPNDKNVKSIWIDPTNNVATSRILLEDISDRWALPIASKGSLVKIPANTPEQNLTKIQKTLKVQKSRDLSVQMTVETNGDSAFKAFSTAKRIPSKQVSSELFNWFVKRTTDVDSWKVKLLTPFGNIVSDLKFNVTYFDNNALIRTSQGYAQSQKVSGFINFLTNTMKDRFTDIWLGFPSQTIVATELNKVVKGELPKDCVADSKWIRYERKTIQEKSMTTTLTQIIKQPQIKISDIKGADFKRFQKELKDCVHDFVFIL